MMPYLDGQDPLTKLVEAPKNRLDIFLILVLRGGDLDPLTGGQVLNDGDFKLHAAPIEKFA